MLHYMLETSFIVMYHQVIRTEFEQILGKTTNYRTYQPLCSEVSIEVNDICCIIMELASLCTIHNGNECPLFFIIGYMVLSILLTLISLIVREFNGRS